MTHAMDLDLSRVIRAPERRGTANTARHTEESISGVGNTLILWTVESLCFNQVCTAHINASADVANVDVCRVDSTCSGEKANAYHNRERDCIL